MFKIIYDWDDADNIEMNLVAEASNRLGIGEYQAFQLGFAAWYGFDPDPELLHQPFFQYLYHNDIPFWARHFARKVIQEDDRGELNPDDAQYHRFDAESMRVNPVVPHWLKGLLVAGFFSLMIAMVLAFSYGTIPTDQRCWFPPCPQMIN